MTSSSGFVKIRDGDRALRQSSIHGPIVSLRRSQDLELAEINRPGEHW